MELNTYKFNCKYVIDSNRQSESNEVLIEVKAENAEAAEKLAIEKFNDQVTTINDDKIIEETTLDVETKATLVK